MDDELENKLLLDDIGATSDSYNRSKTITCNFDIFS